MENSILEEKLKCPIKNCVNRGEMSSCYIESEERCLYFISREFWQEYRKIKEKE